MEVEIRGSGIDSPIPVFIFLHLPDNSKIAERNCGIADHRTEAEGIAAAGGYSAPIGNADHRLDRITYCASVSWEDKDYA